MTYGITGIKTGLGPGEKVPLRREIDEWWFSKNVNDLNQRSLFIYALTRFMNMPADPGNPHDLSFFSIAGIHGQPLTPWDSTDKKTRYYCAHEVATFPPWHRPYMLLYEQRLYEIMLDVIKNGKVFAPQDQAAMKQAADTWRLPYWDWAMKKPAWVPENPDSPQNLAPAIGPNVPFLLTQKTVQVKGVTGVVTLPNPMWRYVLPANPNFPHRKTFGSYGIGDKSDDGDLLRYSQCMATSRHPSTHSPNDGKNYENAWVNGNELNWQAITAQLASSGVGAANTLPEAVYRLFAYDIDFKAFATQGFTLGQFVKTYGSLEAVHGTIHICTGGPGQMSQISVAAFDPVFWLHHCNIDRLYAMWQDLHDKRYNEWLNSADEASDPLAPFHTDTKGSDYTSINCSEQGKLGYTYPELQKWLDIYKTNGVFDKKKYQTQLKATIEVMYSTTGKRVLSLSKNSSIAEAHMASIGPMNLAVENFPPELIAMAPESVQTQATGLSTAVAQAKARKATLVAPEVSEQSTLSSVTDTVAQAAQAVLQPVGLAGGPTESWSELDYVVNVVFDPFALQGQPYTIRIFLGNVPDGQSYGFQNLETEIGVVYNFSAPGSRRGVSEEGCANCKTRQAEGQLSTGQIVLTDYLIQNIGTEQAIRGQPLQTLSRDSVVGYLQRNLHWRITDRYDHVVPKEDVANLKIMVGVTTATHYLEAARFSEFGSYDILYDITQDRLAGATGPAEFGWD